MTLPELVVLLDDDGNAIGQAPKAEVHGPDTPLHLAFSCYLLNSAGEVLVTRRALTKKTWPGVWTNSFCGHPGPGEQMEQAVHRRAVQELGVKITGIRLVLGQFRYRAVDASGIVENEICPVHVASVDGPIDPEPAEVADWEWVPFQALAQSVARTPFAFSPWLGDQLPQLIAHNAFTTQ